MKKIVVSFLCLLLSSVSFAGDKFYPVKCSKGSLDQAFGTNSYRCKEIKKVTEYKQGKCNFPHKLVNQNDKTDCGQGAAGKHVCCHAVIGGINQYMQVDCGLGWDVKKENKKEKSCSRKVDKDVFSKPSI